MTAVAAAQVIPANRRVNWIPNLTVGVVGGIPSRTNIIEANQAPYNADPTGNTPCGSPSGAIQLAINAATNGQVVHLTNGVYDITTGLTVNRNGISLRGDGTNTILVGYMTVGNSPNYSVYASPGFSIVKGSTSGSSNISLSTSSDGLGASFSVGDCFVVSGHTQSSDLTNWEVMASRGGELAASQPTDRNAAIRQWVLVTSIANGTNFGIWPPLVWNFTNAPTAYPFSEIGFLVDAVRTNIGLEDFTLIGTNGSLASGTFAQLYIQGCNNSWITNVASIAGLNHDVWITTCENIEMEGCLINGSRLSPGENEGALLVDNLSGGLIENNIIEGGAPGLEWNDGVVGTAFAYNLFTNNFAGNQDIVMHKTHPLMDLFEGNFISAFELDGYFGSSSHLTVFRNRNQGSFAANRFNTFINLVGNVAGNQNILFDYRRTNVVANYGIFTIGFPNINNFNWSNSTPPVPWNFPGNFFGDDGSFISNGWFVTTNTQFGTNVISGDYHMIPTNLADLQNYTLVGQDPVDTNIYWPVGPPTNATPSNVWFSVNVAISNNWRMYLSQALAYQWRYDTNLSSDIITGNAVMTNQSTFVTVWDAAGAQTLPASYLYPSGPPDYWGTNVWPPVDPLSATPASLLPAQARYLGITQGQGSSGSTAPAGAQWTLFF